MDAVVHSDPWLELGAFDQDASFCILRDGNARSGTVLLNDTEGTRRFLDEWKRRLEADPEAWDQTPLTGMFAKNRRTENPSFTIGLLPASLCYVFDREPENMANPAPVPVIEHLQASREMTERTATPSGQERLNRRHARLKELENNTEDACENAD